MDVSERLTHVINEEDARIIALIEDGHSQKYIAGVTDQETGQLSRRPE